MKKRKPPLSYKGIKKVKFRSRLIRVGLFSQLDYNEPNLEHENRLFRAVLDYALYDLCCTPAKARLDSIKFFHPDYERFREVCLYAGLDHLKVFHMTLFLLKKVFPDYFKELYIYWEEQGSIIKFDPLVLGKDHKLAFS
jgi:hypothetical protein